MVWCQFDHCYYCGRCYREACKPVHGDSPAVRSLVRIAVTGGLIILGSGFGPFAIAALLTAGLPGSYPENGPIGLAILVLLAAGLTWFGVTSLLRRIRHGAALKRHVPEPVVVEDVQMPGLNWRPNRAAPPKRVAALLAIVAGTVLLTVALVAWALLPFSMDRMGSIIGLIPILGIVAAGVGLLAALPFAVPSAIAVADDGIHLWYDSPQDRRSQTDMMKWEDLNILGMSSPSGGDPANRLVRSLRIDSENAMDILVAWQSHRIDHNASSRTGQRVTTRASPIAGTTALHAVPPPPAPGIAPAAVPRRGMVCARCRVRFPGFEGLRLLWCTVDRFYVCRRCWEEGCKEGHGRGIRGVRKPASIVTWTILLVALFALLYAGIAYDYNLTNVWASGPVTRVAALQPGQLVKVVGSIDSGRWVALGGHEVHYLNGWTWDWNATDSFRLSDTSGTVQVRMDEYYIVYSGTYYAPYRVNTDGTVYASGDYVQIVGTVDRSDNGTLYLEAKIVCALKWVAEVALTPNLWSAGGALFLPIAMLAAVGVSTVTLVGRDVRNRRAVGSGPTQRLDTDMEARDLGLDWHENGRGTSPRRRAWTVLACILGGVLLLAIFPGFAPRAYSGYWLLTFIGIVVLAFVGLMSYMLLFGGIGHPSYVAVADDGFHMWFDSPYDRHLSDTIFPWDQIKDIHMTGGRTPHWVLQWTTGETTNLYMLTGKNLRLLLEEWTRRAMPSDESRRAGQSHPEGPSLPEFRL
jgi:hypothetical protein